MARIHRHTHQARVVRVHMKGDEHGEGNVFWTFLHFG